MNHTHLFLTLLSFLFSDFLSAQVWEEYYVATGMKIRYQYDSLSPGIPNGGYEMYIDSTLLISGTFNQGRRHGKWTTYYLKSPNDKRIEGYYVNNKKHHEWKHYGKKGELISEFFFFKGGRVGTWKSYHINGKSWSTIKYERVNKPNDVEVRDEEGVLLFKESWTYSGDSVLSNRTIYYTNGQPYEVREALNGEYHGDQVVYHSNKVVYERKYFENDRLMAVTESRTWNGQPRESGSLYEGTGSFSKYYPNGKKLGEMWFENGLLSDTIVMFHKDGKVSEVSVREEVDGERLETYRQNYNRYGIPEVYLEYNPEVSQYQVVYGRKKNYGDRRVIVYDHEISSCSVKRVLIYDDNNDLITEYQKKNGLRHGSWTKFYGSGDVMQSRQYFHGDIIGNDIEFNRFGKVLEQTVYPSITNESTLDSNWCRTKYENRLVVYKNDFEPFNGNRGYYYEAHPDVLPGYFEENQLIGLAKYHKGISVYDDSIEVGELEYLDNFYGFLSFNLGKVDVLKLKHIGVVNIITLEIDEMGIIQSHKMLKQDKLGISEGIDELLNVKPIFSPTTMNGFPTSIHKLYFVRF